MNNYKFIAMHFERSLKRQTESDIFTLSVENSDREIRFFQCAVSLIITGQACLKFAEKNKTDRRLIENRE